MPQRETARAEPGPRYLRLARQFERQFEHGVLRVGDRMPSLRQLCSEQKISVATALGCYAWLERHGYLRSRPRSGYYVTRAPRVEGPPPAVADEVRGPLPVDPICAAAELDAGPGAARLGPAVVGEAWLPAAALNRSLRIALSAFADAAVRYEDPRGNPRLRRQVARMLFRQGASRAADDLLITSGATEALNLCLRAVAAPGDVVAVESPCCYDILQTLQGLHLRAVEIPHRLGTGIDLELLEQAAGRHSVKAALVNTTCHNPLGDRVSDAAKAELLAFAARRALPIIEGDTFGDLIWSGERPRPLMAFDSTGLVLHCASLAHHLAPGFNLGWASGGRFHPALVRLKRVTNVAAARLPQLALADFLESGGYEKHTRALRQRLWQSVEAARHEILGTFPAGTRLSRPEGGYLLWVQLPDGHDGLDIQRRAAAAGIEILPGVAFSATRQYRSCIRVACGHPWDVLRPALRKLARVVAG